MKTRNTILSALFVLCAMTANVHAQAQRSGGGRGGLGPGTDVVGELRDLLNVLPNRWPNSGAWWTNPALVQRLGITDDQKTKIERAFESHRQRIVSNTALLEKEEAQLARLLEAEPLDRNAVFSQIDRVAQARSEMERANSAMTFEMRETLTRAQWMQLQSPQRVRVGANIIAANLVYQVPPVYPESARQAGIQGDVVLEAEISREGLVETLKVLSGNAQLTQAARDAVIQWRYKPTSLNGAAVPVITTITVSFPFSAGRPAASPAARGQRRDQQ